MLKAMGTISVDASRSRIVVDVSQDMVDYYDWFIQKHYWIQLQKPLHGAHITITNSKFHKDVRWDLAKDYHGKPIEFEYDPYLIQGGFTKGFIMFYLKVFSDEIDQMKQELGIREREGYRGLHLTISNGKGGVRPYWPKMIEVK
jgi:hypothetical protein